MGYGITRVASTNTKIIDGNCNRKVLWLTNASANSIVYIGPDASVTSANAGAVLFQYQSWEGKKDFGDYKGPVYGITGDSTGSAIVHYWEVT